MRNSFVAQIKANEAAQVAPAPETPAEAVVEAVAVEETPAEVQESELEAEEQSSELSDDLKERLMGKVSMKDKLKKAAEKRQAEADALAAEEAQAETEAEEAESEAEEEAVQAPVELEVAGQKFENIEALNTHVTTLTEEANTLKAAVEEYRANEAKIVEIVEAYPEFTQLLGSLAKGDSFRVALIKAGISAEDFNIESEEEEDAEALVEAKHLRKQQIAEQKRIQKQFEDNSSKSEKVLEEVVAEYGLDEKAKEQLITNMASYIQDSMNGIVRKESAVLFLQGMNYTSETQRLAKEAEEKAQKAKAQGEIAGRNAKIEIERQRKKGDGIPSLGGGFSTPAPKGDNLSRLVKQPASSFKQLLKNR